MKREELVTRWLNHLMSTCVLYKDKTNPKLFYYVLNENIKIKRDDKQKIIDIEYQTFWAKNRDLFCSTGPDFYYYLQYWSEKNNWKDYSIRPRSDLDLFKKEMISV